jgi:hypothetical protein
MKMIFALIVGHVVAAAGLFWMGVLLNDRIDQWSHDYQGGITVLSVAFGIYSFAVNAMYQRSRIFHIWVNRLWLTFSRTHTYWQPAFDFDLDPEPDGTSDRAPLLELVASVLSQGPFGKPRTVQTTPTMISVALDDLMCFVVRVNGSHLHVGLDRKLLVPSHLYDIFRQRLARIAEAIQQAISPVAMRYGMTVSFGDGVANPYYGFFVNRVPAELLSSFQVSFRLDRDSACRIEAGTDHVNIESASLIDLFDALTQVLSLRAIPNGAGK